MSKSQFVLFAACAALLQSLPAVAGMPYKIVTASERYVPCIFSFVASQSSPVFHSRSVIATIFRASVTLAMSLRTPRATHSSYNCFSGPSCAAAAFAAPLKTDFNSG